MKSTLDRIESRLQSVIESRLPWFRNRNRQDLLVKELVNALRDQVREDPLGNLVAPDDYIMYLNPEKLEMLQKSPDLTDQLAQTMELSAREAQIHFLLPPTVRLLPDETVSNDQVRVVAGYKHESLGDTASLPIRQDSYSSEALPQNAFLIVGGSQVFPLRQAVTNIGRRKDNHLMIDDPRVSRTHAQIRAVQGGFVLFDLNSTGGTFVNNQRISQWSLQPGDVISLAGATLIYGEDVTAETPPPDGSTQEI